MKAARQATQATQAKQALQVNQTSRRQIVERKEGVIRRSSLVAHRSEVGFTLVEVLIALVLIGVLSGVTYSVMAMGMNAWRRGTGDTAWTQEGFQALQRIVDDARQMATQGKTAPGGGRGPLVRVAGGSGEGNWFVVDPRPDPGMTALAEVRYRLVDRALVRDWFPQYAADGLPPVLVEELTGDAVGLAFRFQSDQGVWQEEWTTPAVVPRALQIRLEREPAPTTRAQARARQVLTAVVALGARG